MLLEAILTLDAQKEYALELRRFPFPPEWGRLQSPLHHLNSWRMQEAGRASVIVAILLRCWLEVRHVQSKFLRALEGLYQTTSQLDVIDKIVEAYAAMGKSNSLILAMSMTPSDRRRLSQYIYDSRSQYQTLCEAAAISCSSRSQNPSRSISRSPSVDATSQDAASIVESDHSTTLNDYAGASTSGMPSSRKSKMFRDWQGRPNVHVGLHYVDVAREYATPNNCNVLIGEDKHQ